MKTILVVDDSPENRQLVAWMLEDAKDGDYTIIEAEDAECSLATLEINHIDLVLMDITLPGMDGKEAIRRIRENSKTKDLPIIALTGHNSAEEKEAIKIAGATMIATKPVDEDELLANIASLINNP